MEGKHRITVSTERDGKLRVKPLAFHLGQTVYHRLAGEDREPGIVTGIMIRPGSVSYLVTWPNRVEQSHYAMELSTEFVQEYQTSG